MMKHTVMAAACSAAALASVLTLGTTASASVRGPHQVIWQAAGEMHPGGRPDECVAVQVSPTVMNAHPPTPLGGVVVTIECADPAPDQYVNWIFIRHENGTGEISTLADPQACMGFGQKGLFHRTNRTVVMQPCSTEAPGGAVGWREYGGQWYVFSTLGFLSASRKGAGNKMTWQQSTSEKYIQTFTTPKWSVAE